MATENSVRIAEYFAHLNNPITNLHRRLTLQSCQEAFHPPDTFALKPAASKAAFELHASAGFA